MMLLLQWEYVLKIDSASDIHVFEKPNNWTLYMLTIFINKIEVAGMMMMTLLCQDRVLLRNFVFHPGYFFFRIVARFWWLTQCLVDHGSA